VSGKVTGWVVHNGPADRVTFLAMLVLADAARNDGTGIRLGMREIAHRGRMSLSVASEAVRRLIDAGLVAVVVPAAGPFPAEYRVVLPQGVDDVPSVRRTEHKRSAQSEHKRSAQSEHKRSAQTERSYRGTTGTTGFTGAAGSLNGRGVRPPSTAEQARIDQCPACDDHGWVFVGRDAALCDHPAVPAEAGGRS